jgi:hypothetical protein
MVNDPGPFGAGAYPENDGKKRRQKMARFPTFYRPGAPGRRGSDAWPEISASVALAACAGSCRRMCRATETAAHNNAQKLIAKAANKSRIENEPDPQVLRNEP